MFILHRDVFILYQLNRMEQMFRRMVAPLARRRIRALLSEGMPQFLAEPLVVLFTDRLATVDRERVRAIEAQRALLSRQRQIFPPVGKIPARLSDGYAMAHRVSVSRAWGTFLYLCAGALHARRILEMGSGAGISGAYLSAAPSCESLTTIEGSASRAALARATLKTLGAPARVRQMDLNAALDEIFEAPDAFFDLMYLDGDHKYESTMRLARRVVPHLNTPAVLILDDIHWSQGMFNAWQEIHTTLGFAFALDVGRFGVCYWDGAPRQTQSANLARYAGWFRDF